MKKEHLSWIPAILIMIMIFIYSSMPAIESTKESMKIADLVIRIYENISNEDLDNDIRINNIETLDHYVRKGAHVTEYALLAIAIAFAFWNKGYKGYSLFLRSVFLTAAYAATDEFHQRFVPGRSGELRDVLIDSIGAILGVLLFLAISRALEHRKTSKKTV